MVTKSSLSKTYISDKKDSAFVVEKLAHRTQDTIEVGITVRVCRDHLQWPTEDEPWLWMFLLMCAMRLGHDSVKEVLLEKHEGLD